MAGRYLVTGVQIGMLKGMLGNGDIKTSLELLDEIEERQFIGNSTNNIAVDVHYSTGMVTLANKYKGTKKKPTKKIPVNKNKK
jgi:hypothetical protein